MIEKLVNYFFGCRHARYSFPVNVRRAKRRPQAASLTGTYVACLDCGKEFPYDWHEMKRVSADRRDSNVTVMPEPARSLAKTA